MVTAVFLQGSCWRQGETSCPGEKKNLSECRESGCGLVAMVSSSKGWHPRLSLGGEIAGELIVLVPTGDG